MNRINEPNSLVDVSPRVFPYWVLWIGLAVAIAGMVYSSFVSKIIPDIAIFWVIFLDIISLLICVFFIRKLFIIGFLGSMLPFIISWRVASIHGSLLGMAISTVVLFVYIIIYIDCILHNQIVTGMSLWGTRLQWQLSTIRIYFGFDMVGHFAEKLFAGADSFHHMSQVFVGFGLPAGGTFVILGGLCELSIAIGLGMGFLTRVAGMGGAIYYLIANHYGNHFQDGFTWNNAPSGGWEYPMLMVVMFASFSIAGAGMFSIDGWLLASGRLPKFLRPLCVSGRPDYTPPNV